MPLLTILFSFHIFTKPMRYINFSLSFAHYGHLLSLSVYTVYTSLSSFSPFIHVHTLYTPTCISPLPVTCRPEPSVTWYHGQEEVVRSSRISFQHDKGVYRMTVLNLNVKDAGEWQCKAVNSYGEAWCSCDLKILGQCRIHHEHVIHYYNFLIILPVMFIWSTKVRCLGP